MFGAAAYGGKIGGTTEEEARELEQMATNVGLGFQIWDDYQMLLPQKKFWENLQAQILDKEKELYWLSKL